MLIPDGYGTLFPYMIVANAATFIDFLIAAFGAVEIHRTHGEHGRIVNSQISIGTTQFMVSDASEAYPPRPGSYYLFVANADATMARALHCGARLEMEVSDKPYGDRQGGVIDPHGNVWWVSQRLVSGPYRD
ncbi:MAG: VOC family protein [Planctomycetes bacterium]|nr:VOC family protein [Planctomycetota bacterium]